MLRVGLAVPVYLILTPLVIHKLGVEMFAVWSFTTVIIGFMSLTEFGFKNSLIYFSANKLQDRLAVNTHFNVALIIYAVMAIIVLISVLLTKEMLVTSVFKVATNLRPSAEFVLWITAVSFGIRFMTIPLQGLMEAHQDHGALQTALAGWLVAHFVGSLIALFTTPSVVSLGIAAVAASIVLVVLTVRQVARYESINLDPTL